MAQPVKRTATRPYRSSLRDEQAAATRARIIEAAAGLFAARGYGRTSIRQIAEAAGVAVDTVYATFGTKARLLTAIIDSRLVPNADADNVMDRPEAKAVRDEPDQRTQVRRFATDVAAILTRVGPVYEILRTAVAVEPAAAGVYAEMNRHRLDNMRRFINWLEHTGPLAVPNETAAATVWAIASPDVGRLLRDGLGWTEDEHAQWLDQVLARSLLSGPAAPRLRP